MSVAPFPNFYNGIHGNTTTPHNHGNTTTPFNHDELTGEPWETVNRRANKEAKYNKSSAGITKGEGVQEGKQRLPLFNMVSKQEGVHKVNQDESEGDEKGKHDPSRNVVNFFFTNFPPEWNKADLHELFAEVGEIADLYVARKVIKAGRKLGFARFFRVGSIRVLENRLNTIRIGNFNLRANIAMFDKLVSDSKKGSKGDGWAFDVPSKSKQSPMVNLSSSLNRAEGRSPTINDVRCVEEGVKIDIESNIIRSGSNSICGEINELMGMDMKCISTREVVMASDSQTEDGSKNPMTIMLANGSEKDLSPDFEGNNRKENNSKRCDDSTKEKDESLVVMR
ncbi:nucleotide-binding alpha-beta plait domain-containing protein [Artemisia annua]|uniref:Nucleotide-binding alpha-beta plait domain-containing protein n=1 Tax=Artemisia annua TaxID=35608 RepID=A0A2U1Q323_ARTAN|nr:nucleotide-binding alpha-beta plait domain-containing protein [Artemisia annua]